MVDEDKQASGSDDDTEYDSDGEKKKKKKKRPVIPGERKSGRSRRSNVSMVCCSSWRSLKSAPIFLHLLFMDSLF